MEGTSLLEVFNMAGGEEKRKKIEELFRKLEKNEVRKGGLYFETSHAKKRSLEGIRRTKDPGESSGEF
jgi:hypothetical protein